MARLSAVAMMTLGWHEASFVVQSEWSEAFMTDIEQQGLKRTGQQTDIHVKTLAAVDIRSLASDWAAAAKQMQQSRQATGGNVWYLLAESWDQLLLCKPQHVICNTLSPLLVAQLWIHPF